MSKYSIDVINVNFIDLLLNNTAITSKLCTELPAASVDKLAAAVHLIDVKNAHCKAFIQQRVIYLTTSDSIIIISYRLQYCEKHKLSWNAHFRYSSLSPLKLQLGLELPLRALWAHLAILLKSHRNKWRGGLLLGQEWKRGNWRWHPY